VKGSAARGLRRSGVGRREVSPLTSKGFGQGAVHSQIFLVFLVQNGPFFVQFFCIHAKGSIAQCPPKYATVQWVKIFFKISQHSTSGKVTDESTVAWLY